MLILQWRTTNPPATYSVDLDSPGSHCLLASSKRRCVWMLNAGTTAWLYCCKWSNVQGPQAKSRYRRIVPSELRPTNFGRLRDLSRSLTLPQQQSLSGKSSAGGSPSSAACPPGSSSSLKQLVDETSRSTRPETSTAARKSSTSPCGSQQESFWSVATRRTPGTD